MLAAGRGRVRAGGGRIIPLAAVLLLGASPPTLMAQSPRGRHRDRTGLRFPRPRYAPGRSVPLENCSRRLRWKRGCRRVARSASYSLNRVNLRMRS